MADPDKTGSCQLSLKKIPFQKNGSFKKIFYEFHLKKVCHKSNYFAKIFWSKIWNIVNLKTQQAPVKKKKKIVVVVWETAAHCFTNY